MLKKLVILCFLASASYASMFDRCTYPPALESFDESKLSGDWVFVGYKGTSEDKVGKCVRVNLNATNYKLHQKVTSLINDKKIITELDYGYFKEATFYSYIYFEPLNWLQKLMGQKQKVNIGKLLALEKEFLLYYTCDQFDPWVSADNVYILTKTATPSNALLMDILKVYNSFGFKNEELGVIDHDPAKCKGFTTD